MTNTPRLVLAAPADYATLCMAGRQALVANGSIGVIENPHDRPLRRDELADLAPTLSAVISGVEQWDEELLGLAPQLKVISKLGVGVDNIDLEAARARGIAVTNAPGGNANAVAELAVGLIISMLRSIPAASVAAVAGDWTRHVGTELTGRSLGLVGFGRIAQTLARRLAGFDLRIRAFDPFPNADAAARLDVQLVSLDEVLAESEIVSLHLPSTPDTRHVADGEFFSRMRDGAYLVNTARGALVDEAALVTAIRSGKLAGAGLDVFETEPLPVGAPLAALPSVVVTSHMAADTRNAYEAIGVINAEAILAVLAGRDPNNLVN